MKNGSFGKAELTGSITGGPGRIVLEYPDGSERIVLDEDQDSSCMAGDTLWATDVNRSPYGIAIHDYQAETLAPLLEEADASMINATETFDQYRLG